MYNYCFDNMTGKLYRVFDDVDFMEQFDWKKNSWVRSQEDISAKKTLIRINEEEAIRMTEEDHIYRK